MGSEFIYENEKEKFLIERVIIFERNKIYRSKNALVINLNKGSGSVDINVEIWYVSNLMHPFICIYYSELWKI